MRTTRVLLMSSPLLLAALASTRAAGESPFASEVVSYAAGTGAALGFKLRGLLAQHRQMGSYMRSLMGRFLTVPIAGFEQRPQ